MALSQPPKRRIEWGFKILGASLETDEYVLDTLNDKMKKMQKLTDVLIQYPKLKLGIVYIDFVTMLK